MQLEALVGWTIMPPSGSAQCVSAGPAVGLPGVGHIEALASASAPLSVMPLLEPELLLAPELLPDPELLLEPELLELLDVDPLELLFPLEEPELEPLVLSVPESAGVLLSSPLQAMKTEHTKAADGPPQTKRRETIDR